CLLTISSRHHCLVRRLRSDLGLALSESVENYALYGCAAGRNQKSAGAWAWELYVRQRGEWRPMGIGSCDPASSMRKQSTLTSFTNHGDCEVCIEQPRTGKKATRT